MIVSGARRNGIEERRLPVCAQPIKEEKGMLLCCARQRIPGYALKIG